MHAPFYVGIGVCAHDKDAVQKVVFSGVVLDAGVAHPKANYSTLETVLLSGDARTGYVSTSHLTSPGWTPDGHALTFERDGQRQEAPFTPLKTAAPAGGPLPAQTDDMSASVPPSDEFNNVSAHLSPDGKFLLFLSYSKDLKSLPAETVSVIIDVLQRHLSNDRAEIAYGHSQHDPLRQRVRQYLA